jgi:hypothetical protein
MEKNNMGKDNRVTYIYIGFTHFILFFLLFYVTGYLEGMGEQVPFSLEAFVQPFFGDMWLVSSLLTCLLLLDIWWYHTSLIPLAMKDEKNHLMAVVFPSAMSVFGFFIGVLELNPWASIPFFAVGFGHYLYGYMKVTQPT